MRRRQIEEFPTQVSEENTIKKGRNLSYASGIKFAGKNVDIKAGIPESSTMFKLAENSSRNGESLGKVLFYVHVV
jgi:hypothetical protein